MKDVLIAFLVGMFVGSAITVFAISLVSVAEDLNGQG